MAEQSSVVNSGTNSNQSRKRRRKTWRDSTSSSPADRSTRWRTETEQQIYSSKLVDELSRLRRPDSSSAVVVRTVRDAADRVLAASAKGRTRWSRAILSGRLSAQLARINKKHRKAARPNAGIKKPVAAAEKKILPPLQRKVLALSRLVPGCRKLGLPNLLEETTDYIAALEMQVKAMTFLTGLLNGGVSTADAGGGGPVADHGRHYFNSSI